MAIVGVGPRRTWCRRQSSWSDLRGEKLQAGTSRRSRSSTLVREGFGAARNPRIALAYASAFIARGDNVVIGAYLSLWAQQAGMAMNMSAGDAQAGAGKLLALIMVAPLPIAALFGVHQRPRRPRHRHDHRVTDLGAVGYLAIRQPRRVRWSRWPYRSGSCSAAA